MIEVYLLAVFVAYVRLGALAHIELGPALYALAALMLTMVAADATLDAEAVWEAMDRRRSHRRAPVRLGLAARHAASAGLRHLPVRHPHRAGRRPARAAASALHARKPNSIARTWALGIAALILYIPANVYPVLTFIQLGYGRAQHDPRRRARVAGGRHVAARRAGVLRQHRGAGAEGGRADPAAADRPRRAPGAGCATAPGCIASSTTSAAGR